DTDIDLTAAEVRSGAATRVGPGQAHWDDGLRVVDPSTAAADDEQLELLDDLEEGWADLDEEAELAEPTMGREADLVEPVEDPAPRNGSDPSSVNGSGVNGSHAPSGAPGEGGR
ncbi:hypothetical protein, partial [Pseudonocardia pini]|uniref:hypothetical protein n=1 Tax=Pseudonocardia pini TaxID=2758030 RepID=UPI0015F09F69